MESKDLIEAMLAHSDIGPSKASLALGKSRNYLTSTMGRGSVPNLDTCLRLCEVTGCRLFVEYPDGALEQIVLPEETA